ncbi:Multiphosphoryl transfer protein 1 [Serratia fonticola]|uniref:Multiphosphoryl transfer protein 1 n=1 Tax=Serratia fonticola TaxID=47917 RepID=A0A4U9WM34_SERFO|nr:Multiphosphoryl transfer protein 1 [Serratia fonticola]
MSFTTFTARRWEAAAGKTIIVRTMDIGGDKPVDYLNIPAENKPVPRLPGGAVSIRSFCRYFVPSLRSIPARFGTRSAEES